MSDSFQAARSFTAARRPDAARTVPLADAAIDTRVLPTLSGGLRRGWQPSPRLRRRMRAAVAVAVLALFAVAVARMDWRRVLDTLAAARLSFFVASLVLSALLVLLRAERWRLLLPGTSVPRRPLFLYLFVAFGLTMVTPAGSPEAMRVYLLRRRHDVPVPIGIAGILLEKLFEGVGMVLLIAPLPLLLPLPTALSVLIATLSTGGVLATALLVWLAHASVRPTWRIFRSSLWQRIAPGLDCLRDPRTFLMLCGTSLAAHVVDCVCAWLMFRSVAIDVPVATTALLLFTFSVALVVPLVPGHVGMLEAGAVAALRTVGVATEPALAFAVLCHAGQMVYVLCALPGITLLRAAQPEEAVQEEASPRLLRRRRIG